VIQAGFDYNRTVVAYHGRRRETARRLVSGEPFARSENDDDWLGHGVYFWEHAPRQAWWWAERRYGSAQASVIGAIIRLGSCLDLLDPANTQIVKAGFDELVQEAKVGQTRLPRNANNYKYLDCVVFNRVYSMLGASGFKVETARGIFVPMLGGKMPRLWKRSGVLAGAHVQLCVREQQNIVAAWSVRRDGRYGEDAT